LSRFSAQSHRRTRYFVRHCPQRRRPSLHRSTRGPPGSAGLSRSRPSERATPYMASAVATRQLFPLSHNARGFRRHANGVRTGRCSRQTPRSPDFKWDPADGWRLGSSSIHFHESQRHSKRCKAITFDPAMIKIDRPMGCLEHGDGNDKQARNRRGDQDKPRPATVPPSRGAEGDSANQKAAKQPADIVKRH
jgi:hypothetical protein